MREFRSVIGPQQTLALRCVAVHPRMTIPRLARTLDMSYGNARRIMHTLEERGLVASSFTGRSRTGRLLPPPPRAILWTTTKAGEELAE